VRNRSSRLFCGFSVLVFLLALHPSAHAAGITLVQNVSAQGSAVSSLSATFASSNAAGNLIIAFVRASTTTQTVTLTDSSRNTYVQAVSQTQSSDGHQIHIYYAKNIAAGPNTVTAAFSGSNNHPWLAIYEYSGLSTTSPLDRTAAAQGSSSLASSGATATTTGANELVFAGLGLPSSSSATAAAGSGYTLEQQDTTAGGSRAATENQAVAATGAYTGTFTLNAAADWSAVLATFVQAGAATPLTVSTSTLPNGTVNAAYTATFSATGGSGTYTNWQIISGGLPNGLSLNSKTGAISGTPTGTGAANFTVQVTDSSSATASKPLSITVNVAVTGTVALVQSGSAEGSGVSSVSNAFAQANTAGNLIIAFVRMSSTTQTVSLSDTAGNQYSAAVSEAQSGDGHQIYIFYASNIRGGVNTVTATFSAANNHPWLAIYEYSGLSTTAPLDQVAHAQGSSNSANSGSTGVTASTNELIFAGLGLPSSSTATVTAGSGFTVVLQDANQNGSRAASENGITGAPGAYSGTFTLSGSTEWSCAAATFRPASVTTASLVSITVTPANPSIGLNQTQQFTATGKYSDGSTLTLTNPNWESSNTAVATISTTGLASGLTTGQTTISASSGTITGSTVLTVPSSSVVHHYEYIFPDGSMYVYDMDNNFNLVKQISLPETTAGTRGVTANPATNTLYISYGGDGGGDGNGSLLAYNLLTDQVMWTVNYNNGIDSMAITWDGKTIYMPTGENSSGSIWNVVNAATGANTGTTITGGPGPHNTVVGLDDTQVYLDPRNGNYLYVASTATNTVIRGIGPLLQDVRPFTINGKQTLAFTTASNFLGFQVGSITTGQVLYTVTVSGFSGSSSFASSAWSHGVSLSPDEKEIWLMDGPNSYVHVFDVSGLPSSAPVQVADLPLTNPITGTKSPCAYDCDREGWVQHSRDGRFVVIGDSGDIFDTTTRQSVANLAPLYNTRIHLEIDWQNGVPIATTTRHGLGYVTQ